MAQTGLYQKSKNAIRFNGLQIGDYAEDKEPKLMEQKQINNNINRLVGHNINTMGKVSESIWSNEENIIPMAEVSHIEKIISLFGIENKQIRIVFKHSKWDDKYQTFEPSISLINKAAESFRKDWCTYRSELESETLMNPYPVEVVAENLKGFFNDIQNICKEYRAVAPPTKTQ